MSPVQVDDQGLVQYDPRYVAVPDTWVNLIPTDVRGLTFSRTPQMVSLSSGPPLPIPQVYMSVPASAAYPVYSY